jgi:Flp pilus assembly pilin Flp
MTLAVRFIRQDHGQDLIEYALLTAVIGLASVAAYDLISSALFNTYTAWGAAINDLWEAPGPGA